MESYRVVDQPTRRRMEELLATWREAGPGGRPMLGDASQQAIERSLYGSQGAPVKAANAPNKSQVIADIERRMALCTKDLANEPHNTRAREQNDVLRQLKEQVNGSDVSAELLGHIQKQLDEMSCASVPTVPAPAPTSAPAAPSASELIANLMKAGLLPSSATTTAAPTSVPSTQSQDKAYTDYIMSLDLRMVTVNLSRPAPELEILMQEHLPHPCRQCANRYPEGEAGQHSLDDHLDWHFTQNRRARASIVRGQSRAWFDPASRWIRSGIDDVMPGASGAPGWEGEDAEFEQALRDKIANAYVPVPDGSELASHTCRICKEPFQSEWSEDLEEWIWRNAVLIEGNHYHASCFYSAKSMSEVVHAARSTTNVKQGEEDDEDVQRKRKASSSPPLPPHKKPLAMLKEEPPP